MSLDQRFSTPERRVLRTDALTELIEELAQLPDTPASPETVAAWHKVWLTVENVRALRRLSEADARTRAIAASPTRCWCPADPEHRQSSGPSPRLSDGTWAPAPDCPIHNGPCECGAPRRADGTLSCVR